MARPCAEDLRVFQYPEGAWMTEALGFVGGDDARAWTELEQAFDHYLNWLELNAYTKQRMQSLKTFVQALRSNGVRTTVRPADNDRPATRVLYGWQVWTVASPEPGERSAATDIHVVLKGDGTYELEERG